MSASCEWSLTMTGRSRNKYLQEILGALSQIEKVEFETGKNIFSVNDGKDWLTNKVRTLISTSNSEAKYIWGDNYLEPEVAPYLLIAKAAPKATWVVKSSCISESGGIGCESYMEAIFEKGELEFKTETYVDTVMLSSLVQRMDTEDDSYESFCNYYLVDDSIDEDTYEEYKFDDCTEDCYFNHVKKTVSMNHIWEITKYTVE